MKKFLLSTLLLLCFYTFSFGHVCWLKEGKEVYLFNQKTGKFETNPIKERSEIQLDCYIKSEKKFILTHKTWYGYVTKTYSKCKKTRVSELKPISKKINLLSLNVSHLSSIDNTQSIAYAIQENKQDTTGTISFEFYDAKTGRVITCKEDLYNKKIKLYLTNTSNKKLYCVIIYKDRDGWYELSDFTAQCEIKPQSTSDSGFDAFELPRSVTDFAIYAQKEIIYKNEINTLLLKLNNGEEELVKAPINNNILVHSISIK